MQPSTRFFINAYGSDDEDAMRLALEWTAAEAAQRSVEAVVVAFSPEILRARRRVLSVAKAQPLGLGQPVPFNGVDLHIVATHWIGDTTSITAKVVLALWLRDRDVATVDAAGLAALCLLRRPGKDGGERWIADSNAIDLRTMQPALAGTTLSAVAAEGLSGIAATDLAFAPDHDRAIETLERLHAASEHFDGPSVYAWATQHGWSDDGASELGRMAADVAGGQHVRRRGSILNEHVVEVWRDRVKRRVAD